MKKYKLAFIGGSKYSIAGTPHYIASQMDDRFEVVAGVFSSKSEINHEMEQAWNVKSYNNYITMLECEDIDIVAILTPTPLHFEALEYLLSKNIPVICEKPLVSSLADAVRLEELSKNKFLVVTNNYSGYPMVRELKERIVNNELGEIINIKLEMPQETFLRPPKSVKYPQPWRLKDDYIPMICLDLGAHLHHLAYFLIEEEPDEIIGHFSTFSSYNVIDDVKMLLNYKDNKKASLWISKSAIGHRNGLSIEVYGTKGSASWVQEKSEELKMSFFNGDKIIVDRGNDCMIANEKRYNRMTSGHPSGFIEAFANLYTDIAEQFDNFNQKNSYKSKYVFGIEHAKNGLNLFHKAKESFEKKEWVKL
ncbi:Gfo/Idh/MocA family oxidoreductase [Sulfurimonas sp. HSL-1716]|uniref:Gfo/Idh/MocA family protein n=1 Tax=Hydrocurvibacter sulfurireducens TaxID=3131937 RepID=UPI0031F9F0C1